MRSSTTDADVASAAVACIACIKDEFEAAFARMKAMARALASRYTHDLLAARVAACACGRACQVSHWKEGGHRETCERTRVPEE